jgi:Zinc finger C-x8-C-x5-C-x3-H type (and similar)
MLQAAIIAHHHAELLAEEPHTRARHTMQDFYEDVFEELAIYGEVENLAVCDNVADHLVGNVYAKFREEEAAAKAVAGLTGRYYAGRPVAPEFSPVSDFRESTCRQYEENTCNRGGYCNFMHIKPISKCVSTSGHYSSRFTGRAACCPPLLLHTCPFLWTGCCVCIHACV